MAFPLLLIPLTTYTPQYGHPTVWSFDMCPFHVRLIGFALILMSIGAWAEECQYSRKALTKIDSDRMSHNVKDFLENDRYGDDWACLMKSRHLKRDSLEDCLPTEEEALNFRADRKMTIEGKISYMGTIPQAYRYDISPEGIEVRIAFKGELGTDEKALEETRKKLEYAGDVWTKNAPGGNLNFRFLQVTADQQPHFTVKLSKKNRGTKYNSDWSITDSQKIVAHEVGHMLGLDDEYPVIRSIVWQVKNNVDTRMCNLRSLMCDYYSHNAKLYPYVYYQILRRPYCLSR